MRTQTSKFPFTTAQMITDFKAANPTFAPFINIPVLDNSDDVEDYALHQFARTLTLAERVPLKTVSVELNETGTEWTVNFTL
jgi:hypothetical protein